MSNHKVIIYLVSVFFLGGKSNLSGHVCLCWPNETARPPEVPRSEPQRDGPRKPENNKSYFHTIYTELRKIWKYTWLLNFIKTYNLYIPT